jgi:predicted MFS family arabinose efflux permease
MKQGSWPSVGLIYLYGVLGSASLSKTIPLQADFAQHLGASPGEFALLISLIAVPAAVFATVAGSLIDRFGARSTLIVAALAGTAANLLYLRADSILMFQAIRVFEGFVLVGAYSAAPALIMATTSDERRGKAMAFWSTYMPVGVSSGLLLSGSFAGGDNWRGGYLLHGCAFLVMAVVGLLLPRPTVTHAARPRLHLLATYAQIGPLRLALTFAALVIMGFGMNTVFPSWYSQTRGVSVGAASGILSVANLAMIVGGLLTALLIARGLAVTTLFRVFAVAGVIASIGLFAPASPTLLCLAALALWLVTTGASTAVVTYSLPRVVHDPLQGASAAGLLSQIAAISTFITPQIWLRLLAQDQWLWFVVVIAICWVAALCLLPLHGDSR